MPAPRHRFLIDRGGTFTDVIGVDADSGEQHCLKVLSSDEAPLLGIRRLLGLSDDAPIPACDVRMGTTLATNALLERSGVDCVLLISRGFGDLLEIGTQARPHIFELNIKKPDVLQRAVVEADVRCAPDGSVSDALDEPALRRELDVPRSKGIRSVAIVLCHAYANPEPERRLARICRELGFEHVSCSHELAAELGLLRRADTTVLDAYLTPLLTEYFAKLRRQLPGSELLVMQSSGELASPEQLRGPASLLSGPAGGVVATRAIAERAEVRAAVGFDMGGTSTDVCRVSGDELPRVYEATTAGVRVLSPMMDIHTVAAGGGSLCRYDGHALSVGPESAGADPGPACYGNPKASELAVTDVNLLLGRLQPDRFPFELQREAAEAALSRLHERVAAGNPAMTRDELCVGLLRIANDNMARAIRQVSVAKGFDVREDALVVFGGAGGQHACALAAALGMKTVLFHPAGGVLSALGMGLATRGCHGVRQLSATRLSSQACEQLQPLFEELEARAETTLHAAGEQLLHERQAELRYRGTEATLTVVWATAPELQSRFEAAHERLYGYVRATHPIEIVRLRLDSKTGEERSLDEGTQRLAPGPAPTPIRHERIFCEGWQPRVPVYLREALAHGTALDGPICILEATGTIVIDPGFSLQVEADGLLRVTRTRVFATDTAPAEPATAGPDPVMLEIMGNAFMSIAEQMGGVLGRTALSTNIRERLDFSCALFDASARLIANAPHIPVHLGAMSESVAAIREQFPNPKPTDVFVTNDPARGGSHLPDITVVTPVFIEGRLLFYTASRGHHADVGGITPGSMPPFSNTLEEEGVVFRGLQVVADGKLLRERILNVLSSGRYPARHPEQNLADLEAQIAANRLGVQLLTELTQTHGLDVVCTFADQLQDYAAELVGDLIASLDLGERRFTDQLDDGTRIGVELERDGRRLKLRFDPTPQHDGNANAPRAVVVAAVLYVLRCLVGRSLPLNSGCLRQVDLQVAPNSLLDPDPERAVSSGNVETSQRVVDVLLGALGAAAASQGTMNNLTFGNQSFAYYETIGGGAGAGADFDGASGVQVHMTNTRITDPEVLESRFPVRLLRFELRRGSGGLGVHRGGDGLVREFEFLEPVEVALVCERRETSPFGLFGGGPGAPGKNSLNGQSLPARARVDAESGDRLLIDTPGGGGFGKPLAP